ncbi:MAG TPA: sigma 54-interacting transcriptional regulator [Bryobacteraceae bacterium]|nr:sigma 54-interacting transcriptional regulator [Bryobacteraceae bacterium]
MHPQEVAFNVGQAPMPLQPSLETQQPDESWRNFLVGESYAMQKVVEIIRLIACRRSTVLITGETGTGKEVVARALHMASTRREFPMVSLNCSAIPATLIEAELFGHTKGAFTGATGTRAGRFELAHKSTIFLDEVGELPMELQAKLLRVLQEREFQRLGSSETIKVDVRIIAAANIDLQQAVAERKFREDLYYRLNVVPIVLPPLRERKSDIPLLVEHFLHKVCREEGLPVKTFSAEALEQLKRYDWPGNVRQIEHVVEMAVVLSGTRTTIIPSDYKLPDRAGKQAAHTLDLPDDGLDFEKALSSIELSLINQALSRTNGNKGRAADLLGLKRTTFLAKLKAFSYGTVDVAGDEVAASGRANYATGGAAC